LYVTSAESGLCRPANLVRKLTIATPIGDLEVAILTIAVIVLKKPSEYNSRDKAAPFVNNIGDCYLTSKLLGTLSLNLQSLYALTIVGFFRADRYDIDAFTSVSVFAGSISVNLGKVLIIVGICHYATSFPDPSIPIYYRQGRK